MKCKFELMRLPFGMLVTALMLVICSDAQVRKTIPVTTGVQVPEVVQVNLKEWFKVLNNLEWKRTYNGNFLAQFNNTLNQAQVIEFEPGGKVINKKTTYPLSGMPEHIQKAIVASYPEMSITACMRLELAGVDPFYKATVAKADFTIKELLISEQGTISE